MRALYAPSTGIVDPWEVAIACMESAVDQGVTLRLASEVTAILTPEAWHDDFVIDTTTGNVRARSIINAAGVHAGKISALLNDRLPEFEIQPRRGQYFVLDKSTRGLVDHVIYPAPTSLGKGVLVIPTLHGNLLIGPDAETLPHEALEATQTTAKGLAFVRERAERLVPGLPFQLTVASFSGIRAESSQGDFILRESENFPRVFHAAGIKSPGLSAAPAIAEYILEHLKDVLPDWRENPDFTPGRRPRPVLSQATQEEKAALIATDPAFSHIVCRCEMVSEAEIVDCIRRSVGATTLNGVKRRVRPGGGRCQGGFCTPRILEILARELGIKATEVLLEHPDSWMVSERESVNRK
jgi:glycerol-3-phosphate dehydrogenase